MSNPVATVPSSTHEPNRSVTPRWTFVDFVVVILGGLAGAFALGLAGSAIAQPNSELTLVASIIGQYAGHLLAIWLIARGRDLGAPSLGFDIITGDILYVGIGVVLQIVMVFLFAPLRDLLVPSGQNPQEIADVLVQLSSPAARIAAVAATTFIAPVTEELIFRGVLLRSMIRRPRWLILVVTALVWALFHVLGVTTVGAGILVVSQIFLMGLVLGYLTLRHDRLGPAIFTHAGFNLLAAIVLLLPPGALDRLGG